VVSAMLCMGLWLCFLVMCTLSDAADRIANYRMDQYDHNACAGLIPDSARCPGVAERDRGQHAACRAQKTSGGVCPIILRCMVIGRSPDKGATAYRRASCTIRPLPGLGFNAAIVNAKASGLMGRWPGWPQEAHYVASDRFEWNNPRVNCTNPMTRSIYAHMMHSSTALSFLDHDFRVVKRTFITGGKCASGLWWSSPHKASAMVTDGRLLELGHGELWMSYTSYWKSSGGCNGSRIARLTNFASYNCEKDGGRKSLNPLKMVSQKQAPCKGLYRRIPSSSGKWSELHPTGVPTGAVFNGATYKELDKILVGRSTVVPWNDTSQADTTLLAAPRNGVIIVSNNERRMPLFEIVNIAPRLELRALDGQYTSHPIPEAFAREGMHSSFHPLWVPELNAYLGGGHRHYRSGMNSKPFRYGYSYRQVLFTLSPVSFAMQRFTREFCLPSLDLGHSACEGIQFITSAFRSVADGRMTPSVGFSYGIQDCESAVLTLSVHRLQQMLEFE